MRWRWWYAAAAEAGGGEGGVVGTRWVMRGRWWVGGVEAAGMVMMAVGDGVRCGGVDGGCGVAAAVGWLGWCEGGVEIWCRGVVTANDGVRNLAWI
ncbi:hypothetical protein Tco_0960304 [Tanacetum coccineum]